MMHLQEKITGLLIVLAMCIPALPARAGLTEDLQDLVVQAAAVQNSLTTFSFADQTCSDLGLINGDIEALVANVDTMKGALPSPLSLTTEDLGSLDSLSEMARTMAAESVRLSLEIQSMENVADLFEYRSALTAILELSNDIGTMADRVLEMANRILAMADNILVMANRILITQQLQNANVALTQASILTTQQNMVALSDSLSTILYNVTLGQLDSGAENLLNNMSMVNLTSGNMAQELEGLEATTNMMVTSVVGLYTWMSEASQGASHYINGDTLTYFGDLSAIYASLAYSLELYSITISQLAPQTDIAVLSDATAAMLRLSADIGVMAGRITEMSDKIIVMADNIGLMADNIVTTQELQQTNITLTESSLLTAQNVTITVIKNMGL